MAALRSLETSVGQVHQILGNVWTRCSWKTFFRLSVARFFPKMSALKSRCRRKKKTSEDRSFLGPTFSGDGTAKFCTCPSVSLLNMWQSLIEFRNLRVENTELVEERIRANTIPPRWQLQRDGHPCVRTMRYVVSGRSYIYRVCSI